MTMTMNRLALNRNNTDQVEFRVKVACCFCQRRIDANAFIAFEPPNFIPVFEVYLPNGWVETYSDSICCDLKACLDKKENSIY